MANHLGSETLVNPGIAGLTTLTATVPARVRFADGIVRITRCGVTVLGIRRTPAKLTRADGEKLAP
jgi:hypothetical protein